MPKPSNQASPTALPEGITLSDLKANWDLCQAEYSRIWKRMQILDGADQGKLWESVRAKFPSYQLLPETNHVNYVKSHLLASLYSIGRQADLVATSKDDVQCVQELNIALENLWSTLDVPYYQMLAGERAALLNQGITWVGWNPNKKGGTGDSFYCGQPTFKNVDPMKFMKDPYAEDMDNASFCIAWDVFHKSVLLSDPAYKSTIQAAIAAASAESVPVERMTDRSTANPSGKKDYFRVEYHFVRDNKGQVHEIHTMNNQHILKVTKNLEPNMFPFAELYCNLPAGNLIGLSEPSKVFANSLVYNIMNSIVATAAYKNQRPPRFVTNQAMINLDAFVKHGNDSDYTFLVNGDASRAVHYQQFPIPGAETTYIASALGQDIKNISGVTDKYTGADTGSLLTTGGMEAMLDQATLIDQPKLNNYERYTRRLTQLITHHYIAFGQKRVYMVKDAKTSLIKTITVDPANFPKDIVFEYQLSISPYLPKNRQRIAQMANVLMEKQMQYGGQQGGVQWITPEEWLMMQDLPMKEMMMERMGLERNADYIKKVSQIIFQYAELTSAGMEPEDALIATASTMEQQATPQQGMTPQNFDPMQVVNQLQVGQ